MRPTRHSKMFWKALSAIVVCAACPATSNLAVHEAYAEDPWVVYDGFDGPGNGKHIVFISGDEEYRSEEALPLLGKILAKQHGFKCTVLFSIDKETGEIDPNTLDNIPGLKALKTADLMVIFTRFRELPDAQMKHIVNYTNSGKPIIGIRTATHAFNYRKNRDSPYVKYGRGNREFRGGFGRQVLGETWVNHWGAHGSESTRGRIAKGMEDHPIVRGCDDIWGPTDVYEVRELGGDSKPLIMGVVLEGMDPNDEPNTAKTQMPVAWIKSYTGDKGKAARVFTATIGAGPDLESEGLRRLFVNAAYWCVGMEDQIPARAKADIIGEFKPNFFGMRTATKIEGTYDGKELKIGGRRTPGSENHTGVPSLAGKTLTTGSGDERYTWAFGEEGKLRVSGGEAGDGTDAEYRQDGTNVHITVPGLGGFKRGMKPSDFKM